MPARIGDDVLTSVDEALLMANWEQAREILESAGDEGETPDALDRLGRALWWLGLTDEAITTRERAYAGYRRLSRLEEAAKLALWLSLEHSAVPGSEAVAGGWMARAEGLIGNAAPSATHGWLELARSGKQTNPALMASHAKGALSIARQFEDPDLETRALARYGRALVALGDVSAGMDRLDEAMAAATSGEGSEPETFAETCCDLAAACEVTLDDGRLNQWGEVIERFLADRPHASMLSFCGTCCAEVSAARGDLQTAEQFLTETIDMLETSGHKARCVEPRARLAELRVAQGRQEEAERLLKGIEGRPEALRSLVALHLATGETATAASLLHARVNRLGRENPAVAPVLALLVPVQIERGDLDGATASADIIGAVAAASGDDRLAAAAELAHGRVAAARGDFEKGVSLLRAAADKFERLVMPLDAARARLELAAALAQNDPELAMAEARTAGAVFEQAGAARDADSSDALVRELGGRSRVGPKDLGLLTRRETDVLHLLAEGLTNAEIADRLYISVKTAGNHVSNILTKLNLRSRTEAGAYAIRNLGS